MWIEGTLPEESEMPIMKCFGAVYFDLLLVIRYPDSVKPITAQGLRIKREATGIEEIDESMASRWHWRPDIGGDDFEVLAWMPLPDASDSAWIPCVQRMPEDDGSLSWHKEPNLAFTTVLALGERSPGWPAEVKMTNRLKIEERGVPALVELGTDGWIWSKGFSCISAWMPLPEYKE